MSIDYIKEIPKESYYLVEEGERGAEFRRVVIERSVFERIGDYTRSQPTSPSAGRVYRKNLMWRDNTPDNWFIYFCESRKGDEGGVYHLAYSVELVDDPVPVS